MRLVCSIWVLCQMQQEKNPSCKQTKNFINLGLTFFFFLFLFLDTAGITASMHGCMQVADANAAVRLCLCMRYFTTLKQLDSEGLSDADKACLQQQLDDIILQTQSRSAVPRCPSCRQPICCSQCGGTIFRKSAMHNCTECRLACCVMLPDSKCKQSSKHIVFGALLMNHNNTASSCKLLGLNEAP